MRIVICVVLMLLFIVLEQSISVDIAIGNIAPNFTIIVLTAFLIWIEELGLYIAALLGGIILDILSGAPLGMNALRYLLTSVLLARIFSTKDIEWPFIPAIISFLWVLFSESMTVLGFYILQQPILTSFDVIIKKATYTAALMFPIFLLLKKLFSIEWMNKKVHFEMTLIHTKK